MPLTTADQVASVIQGQVDGLRAQSYGHTSLLSADVTVLNASSALYRGGAFVRHDRHGGEINRLAVTYLIADGTDGLQIAVLASHGAEPVIHSAGFIHSSSSCGSWRPNVVGAVATVGAWTPNHRRNG